MVRYDWAVQVRHSWEQVYPDSQGRTGMQLTPSTKRVIQLPKYFGGGMGNGVAIATAGALIRVNSGVGDFQSGALMLCHKDPRRAPLTNLTTDFTPVEASMVGGFGSPYGGFSGVSPQMVAQRNGRNAYFLFGRDGNGWFTEPDTDILRCWGPKPAQQKWLGIPNRLTSVAPTGPSASSTWYPGGYGSGFVTDHDRSPMLFLQEGWTTMAFLDNPDWLVNFGLRNWYSTYSSPTSTVYQGYSWAFYQDHSHSADTLACQIMPPVNRYKAPTLYWFVLRNRVTRDSGYGWGSYEADLDVYRAKWLPDQWRPKTDKPYGANSTIANANRDKPYDVSQVDYIRKVVNPKRMGFERSWEDGSHLVTRIKGLAWTTSTAGYARATPHVSVDRASDGTPVIMLHNMHPRMFNGAGTVYAITAGKARLCGVVPPEPGLTTENFGGGYAGHSNGANAALINDIPLFTAEQYLTTTGLPVGQGSITDRGKIYRRGELNRASWLV